MTHTDIDTVAAASAVAERDAHRARYDALRAAGQGETARALPPPTDRGLALDPAAVRHRETIPGGWYWTTRLVRGEALRLVNVAGSSTVSLVAWSVADTSERLNLADTTKVQWSVALRKGRILFTDMGRVALSIVEDTSGRHDALVGRVGCTRGEAAGQCPQLRSNAPCLTLHWITQFRQPSQTAHARVARTGGRWLGRLA